MALPHMKCPHCGGTGIRIRGDMPRGVDPCVACRGRGVFYLGDDQGVFEKTQKHPGVFEKMQKRLGWRRRGE